MIPAAWPYVAALVALAALGAALGPGLLVAPPLLAAAGVAYFFRDPERRPPPGDGIVVAPADGRVVEVADGAGSGGPRIAIFLSLLDVHVNRSPVGGRVRSVTYRAGSFRPAFARAASAENERNTLELESALGRFEVSQIAGVVARRIRCFKRPGDEVGLGERIGYIAFGSRTELALPPRAEVAVRVGDAVRGGETVVARVGAPAAPPGGPAAAGAAAAARGGRP
jgi:phosphatidylserine decarboxylase